MWFPRGPLAEWANIVLITTNDISHGPEAEQLEKLAGTRGDKLRWELSDVMRPHCLWLVNEASTADERPQDARCLRSICLVNHYLSY